MEYKKLLLSALLASFGGLAVDASNKVGHNQPKKPYALGFTGSHLTKNQKSANLMFAIMSGKLVEVEAAVKNGASINKKDKDGMTPLMMAVLSKNVEIARYLLLKGANVNAVDNKSGRTALIFAVNSGNKDMVSLIKSHNAKITVKDSSGKTAAYYAIDTGRKDLEAILKGIERIV